MTALHARAGEALAVPEMDAYVVVLASSTDGEGERIEVQRRLDPFDDQDRELGQDTYSISTHTGATTYAGIEACRLRGSTLDLTLSAAAAKELGVDQEVNVTLDLADQAIARLWDGLLKIFEHDRNQPKILRREEGAG
ncbi:hypothetical protein predicted by Glimmer/Critica [Sorangium cellulosum So ce56]|uniref:Uncharacterized protein n=1 Tax=Sorangium cellulosum (strain So ce56) TaxID=448385 RepID=A9FW03_SORC5|nr:Imm10 family immunity protein [Sorangium cellulosum]CAN92330.1 hypothetical protein predicted by Glimmer/Critica [Sorangium cellulosum So ce56]